MNGLTKEEHQLLLRSVGTHRGARPLSPSEVAHLLYLTTSMGTSRQECAQELGISLSQVGAFLSIPRLVLSIQHLADWKGSPSASIAFSSLVELRSLNASDQLQAAQAILSYSMTWKEVVQLAQISRRSHKPIGECVSEVLALRPQIETRHLFVGAIRGSDTPKWLQALSQNSRDQMLTGILAELAPGYEAKVRLGIREFTILSNHNIAKLLRMSPDEVEDGVNGMLQSLRLGQ